MMAPCPAAARSPGGGRATTPSGALLLSAVLLLGLAGSCHGHGFMLSPASRCRALGRAEWECAGSNGLGAAPYAARNDLADVCGDPHQDVGSLGLAANGNLPIQATYSSGSTVTVTWRMRANHGGWLGVKLCPSTRVNPSQGCFDQYPLTNADTNYQRWWITTGSFGTMTDYTTRWRLPSGVSCDGGCVLQMTYRTANSCVDSCSSAECGPNYSIQRNPITGQCMSGCSLSTCSSTTFTEIFRDCADIRITGGSGGGGGGSGVVNSPPPATTTVRRPPPPANTGGTNCNITPQQFCSGKPTGLYGDRCRSCTWFYNCYPGGAVLQQCAAGTAMDSRGGTGCTWPNTIVC